MADTKKDENTNAKIGAAGALGAAAGAAVGIMAAKALQKKENRQKLGKALHTVKKHATAMMEDVKEGAKDALNDPQVMQATGLTGAKGGRVEKVQPTRKTTKGKK